MTRFGVRPQNGSFCLTSLKNNDIINLGDDIMARQLRILSETGMYHIMFRGLNKQNIFLREKDYEKMIEIIKKVKDEIDLQLFAYCMMPNHVHLLIREAEPGDISVFMKRILSHYAGWYNFKYEREGHLFANRYKSIPVEDESYFLALSRYIHQNPVKASLVENMQHYEYSSYVDYVENNNDFINIDFLLDMLDDNRETSIKNFVKFTNLEDDEDFDLEHHMQSKDAFFKRKIIQITGGMNPYDIRKMPKRERYELVKKLMVEHNLPKASLERILGISKKTLQRIELTRFGV